MDGKFVSGPRPVEKPLPAWMPRTWREIALCLFVASQWFLVGVWVGWRYL